MNRRGFLESVACIIASSTLDPERAVWQPGAKLISIPGRLIKAEGWMDTDGCFHWQQEHEFTLEPPLVGPPLLYLSLFERVAPPPGAGMTGGSYARIPFVNNATKWPQS